MLERVPAAAESTAQFFLRSVEKPVRSSRVLDPRFWRNGVDDIESSAWWPSYLQRVRTVPQTGAPTSEETSASLLPLTTRLVQPAFTRHRREPLPHTSLNSRAQQNGNTPRSYSVSAPASQSAKPQLADEFANVSDQGYNNYSDKSHTGRKEKDIHINEAYSKKHDLKRARQEPRTAISVATPPVRHQFSAFDLTTDTVPDRIDDHDVVHQTLRNDGELGDSTSATSAYSAPSISSYRSSRDKDAKTIVPLATTTTKERRRKRALRRKILSEDGYKSFDLEFPHESSTQDSIGAFDLNMLIQQELRVHRVSPPPPPPKIEIEYMPSASANADPEPDLLGGWGHSNAFSLLVPENDLNSESPKDTLSTLLRTSTKPNNISLDSVGQLAETIVKTPHREFSPTFDEFSEQSETLLEIPEPQTETNGNLTQKMFASLEANWNPLSEPSASSQDQDRDQDQDQSHQLVTPQTESPAVPTLDPKQARFNELLQIKNAATAVQFDEAWSLFLSFNDQESMAPYILRLLTRSQTGKHHSRALAAFNTIPRSRRSEPMYRAAMQIELARYQYGSATNLAFEANIRGFNILPELFAYLVGNLLWKSVAEVLHRNRDARREYAQFAVAPEISATAERRMLSISELIEKCNDITDLHTKVLSLAERIQAPDFVFMEHHGQLKNLCHRLIIQTVRNSTVLADITPQALLTILDLGDLFDNVSLHVTALDTIFQLPENGDKLNLALTVYRNLRFKRADQHPNPRIIRELISLCGEAEQTSNLLYNYLLEQFTPKPDIQAYHQVIVQCARKGDVRAVQKYLELCIRHHGKPPRVAFVNPTVHVYAVAGNTIEARRQFDALETEYGLTPDTFSWNMLMLAHVRSDDDLSAFDVLGEMRKKKVKFNEYTYGQLLAVCAAHGDTEAALDILVDARDDNIQVSVPMINTVVEAYLKNHNHGAALRFAEAASSSEDKQGLTRLWNSLIRYFAFQGQVSGMMKMRNRMARHGIKPDAMTYAPIMSLLTSTQRTSEAMTLLRQMHRQEKIPVNMLHYTIVLNGFVAEDNRDAASLVFNEMKQRFPNISASANAAMLSLQARRDGRVGLRGPESDSSYGVKMLAELTKDISSVKGSPFNVLSSKSQQDRVAISMYFETIIRALIRSGSYDSAAQLMKHVDISTIAGSQDKTATIATSSKGMVLARLDIAMERQDWVEFEQLWKAAFHKVVRLNNSMPPIREGHVVKQERMGAARVAPSAKYSLSAYINRYMEAMARQFRQGEMCDFFRSKLFPSGFQLTGTNWNKYVQVLCRSSSDKDQVRAFKIFETTMRARTQSWKLLRRGMMTKKTTSYLWQPYGQRIRPILQSQNTYRIVKRVEELRLHPGRKVPTYLTAVHLGAVLVRAYEKARAGHQKQLYMIRARAPRSKRFIQLMPRLKDNIQGSILRRLDDRENRKPRPRSEESFREKTNHAGVMGDRSPLNNVPFEYLEDVEEITGRGNVLRSLLKDNSAGRSRRRQEQKDVELGEMFTGWISRAPIMLAGQGRMETEDELQRRIGQEEQQKRKVIETLREDLTARSLARDIYRPLLQAEPPPDFEDSQELDEENQRVEAATAHAFSFLGQQDAVDLRRKSGDKIQGPLGSTPVSQQLDSLAETREQGNKELKARQERSEPIPPLAIPYTSRRHLRRRLALEQRKDARQLLEALETEFSPRAHLLRATAAKRPRELLRAQERRNAVLAYERDLKAGKRLDPFPRTLRGVERRRARHGPVRVRFVSDLGRKNKYNYFVRKGLLYEERKRHLQKTASKGVSNYIERGDRGQRWLDLHYPQKTR